MFASDLHGDLERYENLFRIMLEERPDAVFLGGDLMQHGGDGDSFVDGYLSRRLRALRAGMGEAYPFLFVIPGNDDPGTAEASLLRGAEDELWNYAHNAQHRLDRFAVYGYAFVPPTPFRNKDWERYDVSRYVDPGCVSPEEGSRTVPLQGDEAKWGTIREDLRRLTGEDDLRDAIMLFHTPPYRTKLDRAELDGLAIDHAPADVHVGSIAVRRMIEQRQPLVTLHGHIHESARITGCWKDRIGRTVMLGAAHDGPELALVRFDPERPGAAARELV
jgi:Icc-related predicted phosphoesterase